MRETDITNTNGMVGKTEKNTLSTNETKYHKVVSFKEAKERAEAKTEAFLKKSEEAIKRLSEGDENYKKDPEKYIEDCAYAYVGQVYKKVGKLPHSAKTGRVISLEEFKNLEVTSKVFVESFRSKDDKRKFKSPKDISKAVKNPEEIDAFIKSHNRMADANFKRSVLNVGEALLMAQSSYMKQKAVVNAAAPIQAKPVNAPAKPAARTL
ncbi:MAG: hypothetical protein K6G11_05200 [Lachnospiraceae bacterium]|nr:hypothetical protein [Lachnospiraceae bacterium]